MQLLVVFLVGLSGAGKSCLAKWMVEDLRFKHFDIDPPEGGDGIDTYGLREEWDGFLKGKNAEPFVTLVRQKAADAGAAGALLSFPSTSPFHRWMIDVAAEQGVKTLALYGDPELCMKAFQQRTGESAAKWSDNNREVIPLYGSDAYADVRLEAFKPDGSRWSREEMVGKVRNGLVCDREYDARLGVSVRRLIGHVEW